jgi:beta-N-acetylhexosaminidase
MSEGLSPIVLKATGLLSILAVLACTGSRATASPPLALPELVGARLVVAMGGTAASPELLERTRRGNVSGVILFARNISGFEQLRSLTASLQRAAREGGQAPLLVCLDQEGGAVRRLGWAPPASSPAELGRLPRAAVRREGRATGVALRHTGVNCNLAPVADVPVQGSFVGSRAFAGEPARVAAHASAFAAGLADAGVIAAAKHFPGVGRARVSTDRAAVRIEAPRAALERDLLPFRLLVATGVPLVMLSNASYAAFGPEPAAWSRRIAGSLLRRELGFEGVTITDSLDAPAAARGWVTPRAAFGAARAGVDLLLVTGSEATSQGVFTSLLRAARDGRLPRAGLERSHGRVVELRDGLPASR